MFNFLSTVPDAFDFAGIFGTFVEYWYLYLTLFLALAGIVLFFIFVKPLRRDRLSKTQKLVYVAILTAISTVANCFLTIPITSINSLSFTITVCFIAGYLLGAKCGFVVGFLGDLIGCIVYPMGPYFPLMSLASGLFGFVPGVLFTYFKGNGKFSNYIKAIISALVIFVVCSVVLNSISTWMYYSSKTFWAYIVVRLPLMSANAVMNCVLCILIVGILPRVLPKSKFVFTDKGGENQAVGGEVVKTDEQLIDIKEENNESNTQS